MTRRLALFATLLMPAVLAAPAGAATPDRTVDVGATPEFTFEGAKTTASNVSTEAGEPICGTSPVDYCDYTLIHLTKAGDVKLAIEMETATTDVDTYLYASDDKGAQGKLLKEGSGSAGATETIAFTADPGYFLLVSAYYATQNSGFIAKGKFAAPVAEEPTPAPGPGATPPPTANASPQAVIAKLARSIKAKNLRGFGGTAADKDGTVAKVEIALMAIGKGRTCKQFGANGRFTAAKSCKPARFLAAKGTGRWSFKLRSRLKPGSYIVYARATDAAGLAQSDFPKASRVAFRVR